MNTTRSLINILTPYTVPGLRMKRCGSPGDGGYVVPADLLAKIDVLVTGGVSTDVHFEEDVAGENPKVKIGLFDHTIAAAPDHAPACAVWHKLGLGSADQCISLEEAARLSGATENDLLAVKFDIEFAEWDLIESTPTEFWDRVAVLITEYHGFEDTQQWQRYSSVLALLEPYLIPIHIHANNHAKTVRLKEEGVEFPGTLEATYINRKFIPSDVKIEPWKQAGPTKLDNRNKPWFIDIRLNYWSPTNHVFGRLGRRIVTNVLPWRIRKNMIHQVEKLLPRSLRSFR